MLETDNKLNHVTYSMFTSSDFADNDATDDLKKENEKSFNKQTTEMLQNTLVYI